MKSTSKRFKALLGGLILCVCLFAASVQAATFTVNSTVDAVDAFPGDGVCATAGGVCTLRAAIQEANALAGADVITVPAGTYSFAIAGANEDAAATGDLDITADLTINGAGATTTIIDGNGLDRIFDILGGTVTINDLTVRNGDGGSNGGGGIAVCDRTFAAQPTLHLNNSIVEANITGGRGGGIAVCENGHLVLNDSVVRNNIATSDGGGIEQHISPSTVTITNSTISGNRSNLAGGGVSSFSDLTITNSTISGNFGQGSSGGILHTSGTFTLTNSTVSGNRSEGGGGGLDLAASGGIANLNNVTITNNTADVDADGTEGIGLATAQGGGVHQRGSGTVNFKNTIIAGNVVTGNVDPPAPDCVGTLTSQGYNLIGDTTGCTIVGDTTGNIIGVAPLLAPLALNAPGTTQTHALTGTSPAIDAGNPGTCEATDQRGVSRPQAAVCDIGAFELAALSDSDGDGVPDNLDQCQNSNLSATVVIGSCNSGVSNTLFSNGCSVSDLIAGCAVGATNHGKFVSCVAHLTNDLKGAGTITGGQKGAIQSCAARASIP